jgi:DNA-binding MarR family transcriptional regulator
MTNRLDRLEQAGYIRRLPDPQDRRGTLVQLTEKGLLFIDRAIEVHVNNEQSLISALSKDERDQLRSILSRWLQNFESPPTG